MQIGVAGLGKMGKGLVANMLEKGIDVVVWNRSPDDSKEMESIGAKKTDTLESFCNSLENPKIIWLMVLPGQPTDEVIKALLPFVNSEDLIIDGGNSFYKDTLRRGKELEGKVRFMDIGTSGGPSGARAGACLLVGGDKKDFIRVEPILRLISAENGYSHLGDLGSGHFAKMIHNGIEYGMMQAIAEGANILKNAPFKYDLSQVFDIYNHRSVIESRLVGWAKTAFDEDPELANISSKIGALGEGEWTVKTAEEIGVPAPVIKESFEVRKRSTENSNNFSDKVVSALRGQFGGHAVEIKK